MDYDPPSDIFPNGLAWGELTNVKLEKELAALQKAEALAALNNAKKDF